MNVKSSKLLFFVIRVGLGRVNFWLSGLLVELSFGLVGFFDLS
jgi:hypothetical protein